MGRTTEKMTYTDGSYFCNVCDSPHEGEELAVDCYEACLDDAILDEMAKHAPDCPYRFNRERCCPGRPRCQSPDKE